MQLKKSANANLEDKRLTYVLIGLVFALSVLYVAFEWTTSDVTVAEITDVMVEQFETELDIDQTLQDEETPPPPEPEIPEEQIPDVINVVDNTTETQTIKISSEDDQNKKIDIAPVVKLEEPEEDEDEIFRVVEKQPEFPGGMNALAKYFQSNIRYPVMAQEMGIQGKCICEFVVNKDGSVQDVVVVRSAGDPSLDDEAVRLVKKMPKWKPGEQRGKPVRCKFVVPVTFKIAR